MSAHENTRQTLIARVRDQYDEGSWNEFVSYYEKYIYTVVCRLGLGHHDALDLVQNILLLLWKNLQNFEYQPHKCKFRSWMNKVIRNEVAGFFRKSGRYKDKLARAGELCDFNEEEKPRVYQIAEEEWQLHISKMAFLKVKDSLGDQARECFMLFSEGLAVEDICEKLELKRSTAYHYRKQMLNKLSREIRSLNEELS